MLERKTIYVDERLFLMRKGACFFIQPNKRRNYLKYFIHDTCSFYVLLVLNFSLYILTICGTVLYRDSFT